MQCGESLLRTILEAYFERMLCCPLCKARLEHCPDAYLCHDCGTRYAKKGHIHDFRVIGPAYTRSIAQRQWVEGQKGFEQFADDVARRCSREFYLAEIDSVTEIYTRDFPPFNGALLDVGGGRGTLRHFLSPDVKYLVVDPHIDAFQDLESQPGLLQAYPFLTEPCNFLAGFAEHLPLISRQFNFVHMRSVLDHVFDSQLAIKEAYRVLKHDGKLMIGLSTHDSRPIRSAPVPKIVRIFHRAATIVRSRRLPELVGILRRRLKSSSDHHMWKWRKEDLVDLIQRNGFFIEKLVWQKPPYDYCVYMLCGKIPKSSRLGSERESAVL